MNTVLTLSTISKELISKLSIEKRASIAELISEACMSINSVECELHGTDLQGSSLFDGNEHATLWCQLYELKNLFSTV